MPFDGCSPLWAEWRPAPLLAGYDLMVEPNGGSTLLAIDRPSRFVAEHMGAPTDPEARSHKPCGSIGRGIA